MAIFGLLVGATGLLVVVLWQVSMRFGGRGSFRFLVAGSLLLLALGWASVLAGMRLLRPFPIWWPVALVSLACLGYVMVLSRRVGQSQLNSVLAPLQEGVVLTSPDGQLRWMNPAAEQLFGITFAELKDSVERHNGWNWLQPYLRDPEGAMPQRFLLQQVVESSTPIPHAERLIIRRDGTRLACDVAVYPIKGWRGRTVGALEFFRDMTLAKELMGQQLQHQKLEALEVLAGGIAHDFNNLLQVIRGNLELLHMELSDHNQPDWAGYSEVALGGLDRAASLTRQLGAFAKGIAPRFRTAHLDEILQEAVQLGMRGSSVRCHWSIPDKPWTVSVDVDQLHQVILNLTLNAVAAMPEGGHFWIALESVEDTETETVHATFRDEGVGIPPELLSRIFDPYFSTKAPGRGLGLAMVHAIVGQHGGRIRVESTVGQGTTVHLYLPFADAPESALPSDVDLPGGQGAVLVMDDEPEVLAITRRMLHRLGYTAILVPDGDEAWNAVAAAKAVGSPIHAAILDRTIPGGPGGSAVAARLRVLDAGLPIILASGYSSHQGDNEEARVSVIAKPYTINTLARCLAEVASVPTTLDVSDF